MTKTKNRNKRARAQRFTGKGDDSPGWGISNLCAPLRGIPGRGLFFTQKSGPFHTKCFFVCFYDKTSLFIIKRFDPGGINYSHSMETIYLYLSAQVAVGTFFMKSPV